MAQSKSKLEVFSESIASASQMDIKAIDDSLKNSWDESIAMEQAILCQDVEKYKLEQMSRISARERLRVNTKMAENKRALLQFREQCANEVFQMAKKHIQDFVASDEYPKHMCDLAVKACEMLGMGAAGEAFLRPEDAGLTRLLQEATPNTNLVFREGSFSIGGLQVNCPQKSMRIDMSFDAALSDFVGHFSELSSMYLED